MKNPLPFLLTLALLAGRAAGQGFEAESPDSRWKVAQAGPSIQVVDLQHSNAPALTLIDSLAGYKTLESTWSPDARRLVVIGNAARGSCVWAAWRDGETWRKTLQTDFFPELKASAEANGGILQEHREAGEWKDNERLIVRGAMQFRNRSGLRYVYVLRFQPPGASLTRDRGGYEEGEILGVAYTVESEER